MTCVPFFGAAGLSSPRWTRVPDTGPLTSTLAWVAFWFCTKRGRDIADLVAAAQYARGVKLPPFERVPGTLGEYAAFADTCEPESDRCLTVDDLLPFGSE